MNFELTDDQVSIQRTAKEFLAARYKPAELRRLALEDERGFTDEQWGAIAELGWPALVVGEDDGGLGLGVLELCVVQEQMGYALAPAPFLSTVSATLLIAAAGDAAQKERLLGPLAEGSRRGTVALFDENPSRDPTDIALEPDGSTLNGTKIAVLDGATADVLVVAAAGGRHFLVEAGAPGVTITPADGLDPSRKVATLRLDGVEGEELAGSDEAAVARAYHVIATATAAESVGVAQRTMEMAVQYAGEREQFGRPIGTNQAVSHQCAQMLLETEGARSVVLYAAWALDHEPETGPLAAAMAKAYASDAGWRVPAASLQVHGGIGFTWEHDLHLWLKRGKANAYLWGDARWQRERVAELAGV
jgi:alkylation response protein AidB-like acyl-CoA dehydrogenase